MAGEWPILTLREAGVSLIDCDHRTPPSAGVGYPYIAIPQLKSGHIDLRDARRITREHFVEWTRKAKPRADDIILSRRCNPGETAWVPPGLDCALGQNLVLLRADGNRIDPPFLRWLVRGPMWWEQIGKFLNVGAVFDSLRCADIPIFELPIPPIAEQRRIVGVLSTMDDQIEVLRKNNATLESMAHALFKSWFVEFDPVRAKAEGRIPCGMNAELASLFPSTWDSRGEESIPRGWNRVPLSLVIDIIGGGTPTTSKSEYWNGDIPWFSVVDAPSAGQLFVIDTEKAITKLGLDQSSTRLLPVGTTIISARGTVGKLAIVGRTMAMNQSCYGIRAKDELAHYLTYFRVADAVADLQRGAHGAVFDTITRDTFSHVFAIDVPPAIINAFERIVTPWMDAILSNRREARLLTKQRDALLPKLLSGELTPPANVGAAS